jgi:hypothetical protein
MSRNGSRVDAMHATRSITSTSTVRQGGLSTSKMEFCGRVGQNIYSIEFTITQQNLNLL